MKGTYSTVQAHLQCAELGWADKYIQQFVEE